MATISIQEINKLRSQTGAGLTDCKKALEESNGDFEKAIEYLRKKGQKIAASRGDRESTEGVVLASVSSDGKVGYLLCLACETDFVAKNQDFVGFAAQILSVATQCQAKTLEALASQAFDASGATIQQKIDEMVGKIGEKIYVSKLERIDAPQVVSYIHGANRLGVLVGLSAASAVAEEVGKNVAMQIAAMNPLALDQSTIDPSVLEKEEKFITEQMQAAPSMASKPKDIVEKIAKGKLQSFLKENTLLSQVYVKDNSKTVEDYIKASAGGAKVQSFKRVALG